MGDDTRREMAEVMAALRVVREQGTGGGKADPFEAGVAKLPGKGEWVKAAPGVAMVCGTLLLIAFMSVFAVLAITGTPTDSFFRLVNLFLNALGAISTLTVLAVAMMHARRTLVNRAISAKAAGDAHTEAEQAHRSADLAADQAREAARRAAAAADLAAKTAQEVNGRLTVRLVQALRPIIREAVDEAVERAVNERCDGDEDGSGGGE
jgi:hypothetical protein